MADLKFLRGTASEYTALQTKDNKTFYYTTDDGNLYIGETKLSNGQEVSNALSRLNTAESNIGSLTTKLESLLGEDDTDIKSVAEQIEEAIKAIPDKVGDLSTLVTTAKASAVAAINEVKNEVKALTGGESGGITDMIEGITGSLDDLETEADNLVDAINEVEKKADAADAKADEAKTAAATAKSESVVTVEKANTPENGMFATYEVKQNGAKVGVSINVPKDIALKTGTLTTIDGVKNLQLVLNDSEETKINIPVGELVDAYTSGSEEGEDVVIAVSEANKITATLSSTVKASLALANTALQAAALNDYVKEEDLGELATMDVEDLNLDDYAKTSELTDLAKMTKTALFAETDAKYDAIGSAASAKTAAVNEAKAYAESLMTWGSISE